MQLAIVRILNRRSACRERKQLRPGLWPTVYAAGQSAESRVHRADTPAVEGGLSLRKVGGAVRNLRDVPQSDPNPICASGHHREWAS